MKVKITRSHRKNKELESIKRELQEINEKIQATTTVKMDADQMEFFLNELTERIEWSTNRIVDESKEKIMISPPLSQERKDGFSYLIKKQIAITSWTPRGKNFGHGWSRRIYP